MQIEFDPEKARINPLNHEGVTFDEAKAVLLDPYALTREDMDSSGEARFVTQLIAESAHFAHKVLWFSTLVSKASNLPAIETALKKAGVLESQVVEMSQGQKQSRFVAWTFQTKSEQQIWRRERWTR